MASAVTKVAVYGTLKRGMSNHWMLERAFYLGCDYLDVITLYDLGPYPAARLEHSDGIYVEVFEVSNIMITEMDLLEGCDPRAPEQGMYSRVACETEYGQAWVYIYNKVVARYPRRSVGSWTPARS